MKPLFALALLLAGPPAVCAPAVQAEHLFFGLEMQGRTVGYVESTLTPPGPGQEELVVDTTTLMKLTLLGQDFDSRTHERYLVDPDTDCVTRYECETVTGTMETGSTVVIDGSRALVTTKSGDETRTIELGSDVLLEDSMRYDVVLREIDAAVGSKKSWRTLEFMTATVREVTYTRRADETLDYLGEPVPCAVFEIDQPDLGLQGTIWLELENARMFRVELSNGVLLTRAAPGIVGMIERAELDDVFLARVDTAIADYSAISYMKVRARIRSIGAEITPESLNVPGQSFEGTVEGAMVEGVFEIEHPRYDGTGAPPFPADFASDEAFAKELGPELLTEADDPVLIDFAREHTRGAKDCWEAATKLSEWVSREIAYEIPGGSARATFDARKGECGSHSRLLVALCRGAGIPARLVSGAMYTPNYGGSFGQHAWTEVYMGEAGWIPVDSTAAEFDFVDSGHIRLGYGAGFQPESIEVLDCRAGDVPPGSASTLGAFDPLPWELGTTHTLHYTAGGEVVGSESFTLAREETEAGVAFTCSATLEIGELATSSRFRFDARGRPLAYHLEGKSGSIEYSVDCTFEPGRVVEKAVQAGKPIERTVELPEEVWLLDNNHLSGYALLLSAVPLEEGAVIALKVFHPSSMQLLPVEITVGALESIALAGGTHEGRKVTLVSAGTPLETWVDAGGRLLRESEGGGRLVVELEKP